MSTQLAIIDELRKRNIRQSALARELKVDPSRLNRVLKGNRVSPDLQLRICERLGLPFGEYFPKGAEKLEQKRLRSQKAIRPPKPTAADCEALRKQVKHLLVDLGLDKHGTYAMLIPHLKAPVSRNIISMAMTGYKNGPAAFALLREIREMLHVLFSWSVSVSPCGEHIHEGARQDN